MTLRWNAPNIVGRLLRSEESGAADLASLAIGTAVAGILAGGAAASAAGAIPFAQDAAARQNAAQVGTAEGLSRVLNGRYADTDGLVAARLLLPHRDSAGPQPYAVEADTTGSCFVVVTRSAAGGLFFATDQIPDPEPLEAGTATGCLTPEAVQRLAANTAR